MCSDLQASNPEKQSSNQVSRIQDILLNCIGSEKCSTRTQLELEKNDSPGNNNNKNDNAIIRKSYLAVQFLKLTELN